MNKNIQSNLLQFIELATNSRNAGNKLFIDLAALTIDEVSQLMKLTGKDLTGYVHSLDGSGIIHALKHPNIKASDILLIPFIVQNYDFIGQGKTDGTIVYKKLIGDEYFYVEEIRTGRKKMVIKTLYKRKTRKRRT